MATLTGMRVDALEHWAPRDGARDRRVRLATHASEDPQTARGRPPPVVGQVFMSRLVLGLFAAVLIRVVLGDLPLSRVWMMLTN